MKTTWQTRLAAFAAAAALVCSVINGTYIQARETDAFEIIEEDEVLQDNVRLEEDVGQEELEQVYEDVLEDTTEETVDIDDLEIEDLIEDEDTDELIDEDLLEDAISISDFVMTDETDSVTGSVIELAAEEGSADETVIDSADAAGARHDPAGETEAAESETLSEETEAETQSEALSVTETEPSTASDAESEIETGVEAETESEVTAQRCMLTRTAAFAAVSVTGDEESEEAVEEELSSEPEAELETVEDDDNETSDLEDEKENSLMLLLTDAAPDGEADPSALAQYITSLTIEKDGEAVTGETAIYVGDALTVSFNWTIDGEVYAGNKTYTYMLPVTFKTEDLVTGPVMQGNTVVGTYTVGADGRTVTINYYSSYNTENNTTINTMTISGTAEYVADASEDDMTFLYGDKAETLVVLNQGDFSLEKTAVKQYDNDQLADDSRIVYTVKISSVYGTNGSFTLNDAVTTRRSSSTAETIFESVSYDMESFAIVDENDQPVTGWQISYGGDGQSFTITDLPALAAGGSYTLTYHVNVLETGGSNATEYIDNQISASSGDQTRSDKATVTYRQKINKVSNSYNQYSGMLWRVYIYTQGADVAGYVFTDTAQGTLNTDVGIVIKAYSTAGAELYSSTITPTLSNNGSTFSFAMPAYANYAYVSYWYVYYRTLETFPDGVTSISTTNTAVLRIDGDTTTKEGSWSSTGTGTAKNTGTATPKKSGLGYIINDDGTMTMNWSIDVSFQNLSSQYVYIDDDIGKARYYMDNTSYDYWSDTYTTDHYALAADLEAAFAETDNVLLTFQDEEGNETILSVEQARAQGYTVSFHYYSSTSRSSAYAVAATNASTHVKWFDVYVKAPSGQSKLNLSRLQIASYPTILSMEHMTGGVRWKVINSVKSMDTTSTAEQYYTVPTSEISKYVLGYDSRNVRSWMSSGAVLNAKTANGRVRYRVVITVPEGQTSVTVTDVIPDGLTLVTEGVTDSYHFWGYTTSDGTLTYWSSAANAYVSNWVGPISVGVFTGTTPLRYNNSGNGWTDARRAANIHYTYEGQTLTLTIDNLGDAMKLYTATRQIAIEYECAIDDNLEDVISTTQTIDSAGNQVYVTGTMVNQVTFNELSASTDVTVTQEKSVLAKTGEQVVDDDGVTHQTVHYAVTINEPALDLLEGGDYLTLTDTVTSESLIFAIDRSSIKLYAILNDGSRVEEEPEELHVTLTEDEDGQLTQSFTIVVRDGVSYVLEYDYTILGVRTEGTTKGTMSNSIVMEGVVKADTETSVQKVTAQASSDHGALNIYKVDAKNNTTYLSAKFTLQRYDKDSDTFVTVLENFDVSGDKGKVFEYFAANGILNGNVLYRIIETEAPSGYKLTEEVLYFIIKGNIEAVRSSGGDLALLQVSTQEEAREAACGDLSTLAGDVETADLTIHMLEPTSTASFYIENEQYKPINMPQTGSGTRILVMCTGMLMLLIGLVMLCAGRMWDKRRTAA